MTDTGVNPTKSTGKNRTLHSEGADWIPIQLDHGQAGRLRFLQPPGPPPTGPVPPLPASRAKTTPKNAQSSTSKAQTIEEDISGPARDILITFYQLGGQKEIDKNTGKPYKTAVKALLEALEPNNMSEEEENDVYYHLQWEFRCQKCKDTKPARKFSSCSRKFWANEFEEDVDLHGEKCLLCYEKDLYAKVPQLLNRYGVST